MYGNGPRSAPSSQYINKSPSAAEYGNETCKGISTACWLGGRFSFQYVSMNDKKENDTMEKKKEEEIKIVNTCCSYEGKAPHRCDQCQKCFTRSKFLLKHMRQSSKHGAKRPILKRDKICNICEAQFHSHSTLKQHQITHTGEKLFACPTCDKKFSQSGTLLRHKRSHTGEKNHQCLECGKWFQEESFKTSPTYIQWRETTCMQFM